MPPDDHFPQTSILFESGENLDFLSSKLQAVLASGHSAPGKILVACQPGQKHKLIGKFGAILSIFEIVEVHSLLDDLLSRVTTPFLAYLPAAASYSVPPLERLEKGAPFLMPWIPPVTLSENEWARLVYMAFGWICSKDLLQPLLGREMSLTLSGIERVARESKVSLPYFSAPAGPADGGRKISQTSTPIISSQSKVMALVPHFQCEAWLEQCLDSLVRQTRPPDRILVLDDASPEPPIDIIKKFNQVTLVRSAQNVGPYRLVQSAIEQTKFDAYLFQDADDWSSLDRLERQLQTAEKPEPNGSARKS